MPILQLPSKAYVVCISRHLLGSLCISLHLSASLCISQHLAATQGISWHLAASRGIPRHLPASHGISRYLAASRGISQHHVVSLGISWHLWHLAVSRSILWHPAASHGISWQLTASRGISQHLTASRCILWYLVASLTTGKNVIPTMSAQLPFCALRCSDATTVCVVSFLSASLALVMLHFAIKNLGTKSCAPPNHLIEDPFTLPGLCSQPLAASMAFLHEVGSFDFPRSLLH